MARHACKDQARRSKYATGRLPTLSERRLGGRGRWWRARSRGTAEPPFFDGAASRSGGNWTNEQAAASLGPAGHTDVRRLHQRVRNGKKNNPSARNLAAIAELFGVPMEYFFNSETAAKIDADLRLLLRSGMSGCREWRSGPGSLAESLASLEGIIDQVRKFERLPEQGGNGEERVKPPP